MIMGPRDALVEVRNDDLLVNGLVIGGPEMHWRRLGMTTFL